jgi:hypothetical protein
MNREEPSAAVPERDKQVEEDLWQRHKAERGVWTEPMLAALQRGLKGNKWFSLIDKVARLDVLELAWEKVRRNAGSCGVDGITIGGALRKTAKVGCSPSKSTSARAPINPSQLNGCGLKNRAAWKSDHWGYPRSPTAWCRQR